MCPPRLRRYLLRKPRRYRTNNLELEHDPEVYEEAHRVFSAQMKTFDRNSKETRLRIKEKGTRR